MKIGFVIVSDFVGGAERDVVDHAAAMKEDYGIPVLAIIDSANTELAHLLDANGIRTEAADFQLLRKRGVAVTSLVNLRHVFAQARTLRAIQQRHSLDLLITYSFHSGVVGAIARLLGMKTKLIVRQTARRDLTRRGLMERLQFLAADALTYNSNATRLSYASVASRYPRPQKILYSYVKPVQCRERSERDRLIAEHGLSAETMIVGYFGRIFTYKRVPDVIEAVHLLNKTTPGKFFLVIAGSSPAPSEYERLVMGLAEAKCPGRHHFCKFVSNPFSLMAACDVLVLPSIEPFGRVIVESMYLGVPFVATDAAGPREIMDIADARCGKLVPPMRPDRIAEAIVRLTTNPRDEIPVVPYPLTRDGIVGGAIQFYQKLLAGPNAAHEQVQGIGWLPRDHPGGRLDQSNGRPEPRVIREVL